MKAKVLILAWLLLCLNSSLIAQSTGQNGNRIYGTVTDPVSDAALEFATAMLLRMPDSTVVSSYITEQNGRFNFNNIPAGDYIVRIAYMGYTSNDKPLRVTPDKKEYDAGIISMELSSNQLDAAVVTVKVPLIERKIDKMIMNVEDAVATAGNNALDILKKAPGVTVDQDGNIKLLGSGVLVQIDGRNTYLSSSDLSVLLNGMEASEITKIEIINSPSSSQDASGSSGIINIRTKKSVIAGINGNINTGVTAAKYWGYYAGGRLNFRNAWMSAYGSVNYRDNENFNTIEQLRNFNQATPPSVFHSFSDSRFKGKNLNYRVGMDFYLNPKNTLGILFTGNNGKEDGSSIANTTNTINSGIESKSETNNMRDEKNNGITFNANYRKLFDKDGQSLSFDFDYAKFNNKQNEDRDNHFWNMLTSRDSVWLIRTYSPRDVEVFSGKTDFVTVIGTTAQLEAGAKISYSQTSNDLDWQNNLTGIWEYDETRSNQFDYDERVTAAYASIGKQFSPKLSAKVGLRWENTWSKGYSPTTGDKKTRNYNDFFPTVFLQYKPWEKHDFSFTFNRRIQRPNYNDLNPFRLYFDAYSYVSGNADLKPQYTLNLNLSHSFNNALITTLLYQRQTDLIVQVPEQSEELGESGVLQDNFGYNDMIGINISVPQLPLTKWWTISANVYGAWSHAHSKQDDIVYDSYHLMAMGYLSNNFTFLKTWRAEASVNATSPVAWGFFKMKAQYYMSIGVKKTLFNYLDLSVNFDDPFKLSKNKMDVKYDKYDYHYETKWMSQRVRVGLVWRFGSNKIKPVQERRGGNEDELSRINTNQ